MSIKSNSAKYKVDEMLADKFEIRGKFRGGDRHFICRASCSSLKDPKLQNFMFHAMMCGWFWFLAAICCTDCWSKSKEKMFWHHLTREVARLCWRCWSLNQSGLRHPEPMGNGRDKVFFCCSNAGWLLPPHTKFLILIAGLFVRSHHLSKYSVA